MVRKSGAILQEGETLPDPGKKEASSSIEILRTLGDVLRKHHNQTQARVYYEEASAIFGNLGDRVDYARILNSYGQYMTKWGVVVRIWESDSKSFQELLGAG